ncbi:MAG: sel1 repeat family protein [Alphaproteobacteria bacterium]|nr:sel1 repeat family protein [Alphaproteobacteria bacterium]
MKRAAAALVVLLAVGLSGAGAADKDDGYLAYARGDYAEALRIWRPRAEQGDIAAQSNLGILYFSGLGVPQHYAEALKWTQMAADKGDPRAQLRLGIMHATGRGVPADFAAAAKWFERAAAQGEAQSQFNLGRLYEHGRGVERDLVRAHLWFNLAAANSTPGWDRQDAIANRDRIAGRLKPEQMADAQARAREWKPVK